MFELHSRLQADTRLLGDLPLCRNLYHGIVNAYRNSSEKGGKCR